MALRAVLVREGDEDPDNPSPLSISLAPTPFPLRSGSLTGGPRLLARVHIRARAVLLTSGHGQAKGPLSVFARTSGSCRAGFRPGLLASGPHRSAPAGGGGGGGGGAAPGGGGGGGGAGGFWAPPNPHRGPPPPPPRSQPLFLISALRSLFDGREALVPFHRERFA
jgi:hypothetical protein